MKIELANGKYTYLFNEGTGVQECLRHGEPWRKEDLIGDNLILTMAQRIVELESDVDMLCNNI